MTAPKLTMAAVCPHVRLVSTVLGRTGCKSEGEEVAVTISALVTHSAVAVDLLSGTRTVPAPSTGAPSTDTHEGVPLSGSRLLSGAFWDGVATATSAHRVVGDPRRPTGCPSIREALGEPQGRLELISQQWFPSPLI
eukprot:m.296573 g.296573  ORF g.296573 m.296573 type:complete len:137 (-) comp16274_c0_seq11:235-645(-)